MKVPNGRRAGRVGGRQVNGTGLSWRGRGRSGKPVLKDKGPEAQRKWLHHCLRTLHKALKNARIFEQRKLKRRLVLLQQLGKDVMPVPERDQHAAGGETATDGDPHAVTRCALMMSRAASPALALRCAVLDGEKLRSQLESSKTLDLNDMAVQLALKSGFPDNLVQAAAPRVPPATRVSHLKEPQQRPQQLGSGRDPCEPGPCDRNGNSSGTGGGSGNVGSDPLVTVLASRLLRASCVRKAVEDARRDFEAKFGTSLGTKSGDSEPESEPQDSEDAVGDEGEDDDEDAGTGRGDEEAGNSEDTEMSDVDQREREEGEDGGMALRPHKRQRGLTRAASGDMGSPAAMRRDLQEEKEEEEAAAEEVRKPPDGDGAGGNESDDSGVIEEADIDDFLAEGAGVDPPVGGDGNPGSEDDDRYSNDGGESGDGGGSDGGGSLSFDSEDFDLPARQKSGDAASKGPTEAKGSRGHGGDGGGSGGGGSSARAATAKATSGVKLPPDAVTLEARKARPSNAVARSSRALKADGGAAKASCPPAECKRGGGPRSQARTAAAPQVRQGKKLKRDGDDPLLDRKGKNRLGQNARRRLYEKLYGAEARHVQQHQHQHQQQQERRSAKAERGQRHDMQDRPPTDRGTSRSGGGGKQPITASAATSGEHQHQQLHPSWVAKQRQKQLLMQQAATAAPKKITFNDDDDGNGGGDVHQGMETASTRPKRGENGSRDAGDRKPGVSSCGMRRGGEGMRNSQARGRAGDAQPAQRGRGAGGGAGGRGPGGKGNGGGDTGSLHPSWAARQRQKEQLLVAAPAGKKIVFED